MRGRFWLLALVWWAAWSPAAPVHAAACSEPDPFSYYVDPRAAFDQYPIVALGHTVGVDSHGHLILSLTHVFKGNPPRRIDLGKPGMCGDPIGRAKAGVFLRHTRRGWRAETLPWQAVVAAAQPLPRDGVGQAVLLEATGSTRNPLMALDARGRMLFTAPPGHVFRTVSICPGRRLAVGWRTGGSELLTLPTLRPAGHGPDPAGWPRSKDFQAECLAADGHAAVAVAGSINTSRWRAGFVTRRGPRTVLRVSAYYVRLAGARRVTVENPSGRPPGLHLVDLRTGHAGPRLAWPADSDLQSVSPDGAHAVAILGDPRGPTVIVDLRGRRPRVAHRIGVGCDFNVSWIDPRRFWCDGGGPHRFVDLRGRIVGSTSGGSTGHPATGAGGWVFVPYSSRLGRVSRHGGAMRVFHLAAWATELDSLTG